MTEAASKYKTETAEHIESDEGHDEKPSKDKITNTTIFAILRKHM